MYYCNNYNIKKGFLRKLTTSEKPHHPDARFIRLASQGVFIYYFPTKKIVVGKDPNYPQG